jgi:transmembrane sensor
MSMRDTDPPAGDLHETAAHWHVRLREAPDSASVQQALRAWLAADPAHRLAYADVCAAALACEQLPAAGDGQLAGRATARRPAAGARPVHRRRRTLAFAGAALAACLLALLLVPDLGLRLRADHLGRPGEVLRHTLADGSTLSLDGASAVRVRFGAHLREVVLLRGAVHVEVQPDPARPFLVRSGELEARALGTRYAVAAEGLLTRVVVDHGRVAVRRGAGESVELSAGQMLLSSNAGAPLQVAAREAGASDWLDGRLVFSAMPFEQALAAMARHLPERVVLAQSRPDDPVTAVAPVGDALRLLERLGRERGYRVTRIPGVLIVLH